MKENQGRAKRGGRDEPILQKQLTITKKIIDVGEDVQKSEPSYASGGNAKWCGHFGNGLTVLQKVKHKDPI